MDTYQEIQIQPLTKDLIQFSAVDKYYQFIRIIIFV